MKLKHFEELNFYSPSNGTITWPTTERPPPLTLCIPVSWKKVDPLNSGYWFHDLFPVCKVLICLSKSLIKAFNFKDQENLLRLLDLFPVIFAPCVSRTRTARLSIFRRGRFLSVSCRIWFLQTKSPRLSWSSWWFRRLRLLRRFPSWLLAVSAWS